MKLENGFLELLQWNAFRKLWATLKIREENSFVDGACENKCHPSASSKISWWDTNKNLFLKYLYKIDKR